MYPVTLLRRRAAAVSPSLEPDTKGRAHGASRAERCGTYRNKQPSILFGVNGWILSILLK